MSDIDLASLLTWIGRSERAEEVLSPVPAQCLAATLSLPEALHPRGHLPLPWHWLHFPDLTPTDRLGDDGAPREQALLPPVPLEQVMWAGASLESRRPLRTGVATQRESTLADLSVKQGRRGTMVFVTTEHRYAQEGALALVERVNLVFLGAANGSTRETPAPAAARRREWLVNEVVLFRYSALTFNPHRIHYDLPYATQAGGYPGLVVHGPLQATLLAETFRAWHPDRTVRRAEFRARAPLFLGTPVVVEAEPLQGDTCRLWTRSSGGGVAMECAITSDPAAEARA
ncbi:MaoC family dehydratase N-terminal domain-containing protein [Caldimonas thermodepolymerans]|uniref:3-methylfumaryl-CoA hydratase n=1 Tax=Caldimonas thermodepolymerans TaxID=215580 RepID=A0A2S5T5K0_9BURK|nr:MaoC family dehydratase N-terminal domain-containing protein [Caldimonas thermodepolymerans]PPE70147.1 acyl-CoA dehydrogenase [Caldimonas thermodepolymerans]QPC32141.1 MaoC family dehydratase N-terminal domain-containing protein [Caldimonas thermodepolymerans]RDH98027.1 3-methylfumaryl-CoA hydratase [Caldimonas thermodepolymerans]TCP08198.1 3-methylfumaryl-CoA hydratase [Caldimonas thermodepolymerans]UZG48685.1 MaoC family dehydratase N-terminal domain-containing protein [Caldimonas thermod